MLNWIREPLLHFLLLGIVIFMVVEYQRPVAQDESLIQVDKDSLVRFYQFRTQSFTDHAADALEKLPANRMRDLIQQFVQEEALYRTALSYGMDKDDYVIRRRLVQKVEFLAEDDPEADRDLAESEIRAFYVTNAENFKQPGTVTFTHVFLSADRHGAKLSDHASALQKMLNEKRVSFSESGQYGDRFPYLRNYVERSSEEVASHFGAEMASALFAFSPESAQWQGPIFSAYGAHVVLLTSLQSSRVPDIEEVRGKIATELVTLRNKKYQQQFIEDLVGRYDVEVAEDYQSFVDPAQ